jgi:hypothetical protein
MNTRSTTLVAIILLAAFSRLIPHPPNVAPIAAIALFGGAFFPSRRIAFLVPLAAMLLSDVGLAIFLYSGRTLVHSQPIIYACFLATVALGRLIHNRRSPWNVAAIALASSVLFYLVTNFAVWADGTLYPHTLAGLETSYLAALPFFRNSLAGDLAFTALLFGGFALLQRLAPSLRESSQPAPC